MGSEFEMSIMRELNFLLGLQVKQSQKGTLISQQKYIKKLLKRFGMEASKVIDTLIAIATRLDVDEPGSLISGGQEKHVWNGTFPGFFSNLMGYKETKLGGTLNCKTGICSSCVLLCSIVVDQAAVGRLCSVLCCGPLMCDNTSALNMANNPVQHKRTKHIDVCHHVLRNNVEKGLICKKFCSTEDQIADIFTKVDTHDDYRANKQLMQCALVKMAKLTDARLVREPGSPDTS
ncbi:uncharacterized protein LOC142181031 [Nicotiana tabacum]|uniref:Uncharacterized protein LOC142181031 n=1 Tax=Nicotiana tabacum TaxID=4097 RepID=A0AC58UIC3_TOBAC